MLGRSGSSVNDIEFNAHGSEFVTASENGIITIRAAPDDRTMRS
jgi:hypothetical protein